MPSSPFQQSKELDRQIRQWIASKSGRELARVMRQSRQYLELRRQTKPKRGRVALWAEWEFRLLGKMKDSDLAKLTKRTPEAVAGCRQNRKIEAFESRNWTQKEIAFLGTQPDFKIAKLLGRTKYAVQLKRHSLGIPPCWENRRQWTKKEDSLLGTMSDGKLAKRLGRSVGSVKSRRNDTTSKRFRRSPRPWMPHELKLLGTLPDKALARRLDRHPALIWSKRTQLEIPSYSQRPGLGR